MTQMKNMKKMMKKKNIKKGKNGGYQRTPSAEMGGFRTIENKSPILLLSFSYGPMRS